MEFTLFIISMLFTLASRPAQMQKCFKVTNLVKGQCTFYNSTALSSKEEVHDAIIIEHFKPLFSSSCSPYAQILVCSTFLSFCVSSHRQVQPCHPHFPEVKSSCIHHYHTSNIAWPSTLNCSKLPSPQVCISPLLSDFSLLFIFTFLRFFTSPSSTMPPPFPRSKIILHSPFSHNQYSMAIHTELLKTAISSSSLYFSTLVINIAFSCLCPCVVISIFSVFQLTAIFNTSSHPSSFVTFTFSCFSAFNFTLHPPSIIFTQSTTYIRWHKCHFCSPHSTAITYSIIIINISNTNTYSASSSSKTSSAHLPEHWRSKFIPPYQISVNIKL